MNDDVKAAVEYVREQTDMRVVEWKRTLYGHLLAYIDGEPARLAAAVAAAREEQREACAKLVDLAAIHESPAAPNYLDDLAESVRVSSLAATPLADRIAELKADLLEADTGYLVDAERAEKAEARVEAARAVAADGIEHSAERSDVRTFCEAVLRAMDEAKPK